MTADHDEVIVVLGAAVRPDGTPSPALVRRVRGAVSLYEQRRRTIVVTGRGRGPSSEAEVMADLLSSAGVRPDDILLEARSSNTSENAAFVAALLGVRPVVVVTDGFHVPRARRSFRAHFPDVRTVAVQGSRRSRVRGWARELVRLLVVWR